MQINKLSKNFFIFILLIVTWAFFDVLSPYFSAILWSSILSVIFYPLKQKIKIIIGNRNSLASLISMSIIFLLVFIPLIVIVSSLIFEINMIYAKLQSNNSRLHEVISWFFMHFPDWGKLFLIEHHLNDPSQIQKKLSEIILKGGHYLASSAFIIGKGTFGLTVNFCVMLYLLFFLLKDGKKLVNQILIAMPLSDFTKQHLFSKFVAAIRATVKGTAVAALIQGALGGIAFYIVNIEGSILWAALMTFLSLIPAIGSAIIWLPAAIYFFITQQIWQGIFLIGFFLITIGLLDNVLKPILVRKDIKIPDYLVLVATIGGIEIYGINGFIIGPLIAALFIACWNLVLDQNNESKSGKIV